MEQQHARHRPGHSIPSPLTAPANSHDETVGQHQRRVQIVHEGPVLERDGDALDVDDYEFYYSSSSESGSCSSSCDSQDEEDESEQQRCHSHKDKNATHSSGMNEEATLPERALSNASCTEKSSTTNAPSVQRTVGSVLTESVIISSTAPPIGLANAEAAAPDRSHPLTAARKVQRPVSQKHGRRRRRVCDARSKHKNSMPMTTTSSSSTSTSSTTEVGCLGRLWRRLLQRILQYGLDHVNCLRLSRILQNNLPFLTAHEALLLSQVLDALDRRGSEEHHHSSSPLDHHRDTTDQAAAHSIWKRAFANRNVSRLVVQAVAARFDFWYHWPTAVTNNRWFDLAAQCIPVIGPLCFAFPATENFASTRNHAVASIFRLLLGPGQWWTRVVTGGRQGLVTDGDAPHHTPAQNLAAESNGFEAANRNQYGTHLGRQYTNAFRLAHRLPTDESLLRTFVTSPLSTLVNNGVVHTLRVVSRHWTNMLVHQVEFGNFAHQRMELLDPFETLRIQLPTVLLALSSLRGRNVWDAIVLGPFMQRLTNLDVEESIETAHSLVHELLESHMVQSVCGGIPSVVQPYTQWLQMIALSLDRIQHEAHQVSALVASVELGIQYGYDILTQVSCMSLPTNAQLVQSIHAYIQEANQVDASSASNTTGTTFKSSARTRSNHADVAQTIVNHRCIAAALERTTPRDKRTLMELIRLDGLSRTKPAQLLVARVTTLLQREIRRDALNRAIVQESQQGEYVSSLSALCVDDWYWLESAKRCELYIYMGQNSNGKKLKLQHVLSGSTKLVSVSAFYGRRRCVRLRHYLPIAEAICRAQKALVTLELEHGKRFSLNAFMEFGSLRLPLRRLLVVGQMACDALDNARLFLLGEIQRTRPPQTLGQAKNVTPQNIIVIGGGPAGMMACLHCTENCLASGGTMKLLEARDAFAKGGSTYERAQIVRLDARWITTLRYHLGTAFEDVWIPASGETDAQLGNTLPSQGFIEITIKDLENVLHVEISRFWSKGLIAVFTDSRSQFDPSTNSITKLGENLKVGDVVLRNLDVNGLVSDKEYPWRVIELVYTRLLGIDELKVGEVYGVYYRPEQVVLPFALVRVDLDTKMYHFQSCTTGADNLLVHVTDLPSAYPAGTGTKAHADVHKVVLESLEAGPGKACVQVTLLMDEIKKEKFTLHVGDCHVIEAIGKLHNSPVHFQVTTPEPHGVCCLEGLKVSLGMHNFGVTRWGAGIVDDIRSLNDRNTRIVGDFTKMVRTAPIVELMCKVISTDASWAAHFASLVSQAGFSELNAIDPVLPKLRIACNWLALNSTNFRRATLQTRFFEVGDNFYLGMEFPREYNRWKLNLVDQLTVKLRKPQSARSRSLKRTLAHGIDRLWYFACLETIRTGDVYNPGARRRIPRLHLVSTSTLMTLGSLPVGESFRLADSVDDKYEVLEVTPFSVVVRNVEGYVSVIKKSALVTRETNLTRCPDGNRESKVALATFPVAHDVNHRAMRLSSEATGCVIAFIGDEQASPHFMRYSGLTGAMINAASFNNFIQAALQGVPLVDRFRAYAKETNWSNAEVVQRGTGGNFGEDGFLRPGFSYHECVDYLYAKVVEHMESDQDLEHVLSRDWKAKMAASLIPRGLEVHREFISFLRLQWRKAVFLRTQQEMVASGLSLDESLFRAMRAAYAKLGPSLISSTTDWDHFLKQLPTDATAKIVLQRRLFTIARSLDCIGEQVIDFASEARLYNERVTLQLFHQPKAVDSVVDDFAVEAQTFTTALTFAAAFGAAMLALRLIERPIAGVVSALLGSLSIIVAFGTMTNVSRYKIRNEEARVHFKDAQFSRATLAVYSMMGKESQRAVPAELNPVLQSLDEACRQFQRDATYYDHGETSTFDAAFESLLGNDLTELSLRTFQSALIQLISDTYQVNSYLQESLVNVYRATEEVVFYSFNPTANTRQQSMADELFYQLIQFEHRLEESLQRGPVRYGFLKSRKLRHWDIVVVCRYCYSLVWRCPARSCWFVPIQAETASLLHQFQAVARQKGGRLLSREIRDVETLYWATRESDVASLIFVSASLTFASSLVFTLAWLFSVDSVAKLAFLSAAVSTTGALLAMFHLFRKFFILVGLLAVLYKKDRVNTSNSSPKMGLVQYVTVIQLLLTLARFVTATAATTALALAFLENAYGDKMATPSTLPFWIAMGAFLLSVGSSLFFFVVDFVVRYKLPTELGPFICQLFHREIMELHATFVERPKSSITNEHALVAETWEYTARAFLHAYRFDTVFAADRFGQILQFLQAGMVDAHPQH